MNEKSAQTLELPKILERLARHTAFSASRELALALTPTPYLDEAQERLQETSEARLLLASHDHITVGGARDVRPDALAAERGVLLEPQTLLDIRATLRQATTLHRFIGRLGGQFPRLADVADRLEECTALQHEIGRVLDETGEIMDSASPKLATVRREMRIAFDRLQDKLHNIINNTNNATYLQEKLITQRHGRYVIPLRAEFKGRIPGIVHDQSSSGATLFIEPLSTVELNNTWRELQLEEENEIRRILRELSDLVGHEARYIVRTVETLALLDLAFAKAKYAEAIEAEAPELVGFRDAPHPHPGSTIHLLRARHPLLDPKTVVAIDVDMDEETYVLVITGPNTGGKTVSLKTTGLLTLMAQAGLAIPAAEGSRVSVFEQVFADIGDEQSIEQSLSTFSSHMTHIVEILGQADARSLVLLDELGAGTDPEEGAALAQALLKTLLDRSITALATTHYSELKVFAHTTPFVANASVEFDIETLSPTFKLSIGLPGRSNAFAIARRLGLPREIVAQAEILVSPQSLETEMMLAEIKRAREAALAAESEAKAAQRRAEALNADLSYRLAKIEEARRAVLDETRGLAEAELAALQEEVDRLRGELAGLPRDAAPAGGRSLHERWLAEAEDALARRAAQARPLPALRAPEPLRVEGPLQVGDRVWVPSLQASGEIAAVSGREVEVKIGSFRVRLAASRVELRERSAQPAVQVQSGGAQPRPASPGMELDLRGLTVDDMLGELDRYLDTAYLAGLPFVRIIHGKGTGALRQAVREELRSHPLVGEFRAGENNEGGEGVTVARLVQR